MKEIIIKKLVFILWFSSFFILVNAQAPGYMGKKTVIGYGFYINPAFAAAITDFGTNIVNTQHEFFIERALKRGVTLGFSVRLYKSSYNNTGGLEPTSLPNNIYNYYYDYKTSPEGSFNIKGKNYALYLKLFGRKYVAPWGKYFLVGLTLNTRKCTYDPDKMYVEYTAATPNGNYETVTLNNFGPTTQKYVYPDILLGFGHSRIIRNRLVLDYGCNINAIAMALTAIEFLDLYHPSTDQYIHEYSGMRVRGINRFNFFFKAGYLF